MYRSNNPYRPIRTAVLETIDENPTIMTLKLKPDEQISFETGQFIELTVPGAGLLPAVQAIPVARAGFETGCGDDDDPADS